MKWHVSDTFRTYQAETPEGSISIHNYGDPDVGFNHDWVVTWHGKDGRMARIGVGDVEYAKFMCKRIFEEWVDKYSLDDRLDFFFAGGRTIETRGF